MRIENLAAFVVLCGMAAAHGWDDHQPDHHDEHHNSKPNYIFKYGVKDSKTGDIKDQWEHRDGDHVKGSYSLKEADGTTRVVEYHADGKTGFHAYVRKIGHAKHPESHYHHHHHHHGHHGHLHGNSHHDHGYGHASSYIDVHHY